jgi:hypothetical protein
VHVGPDDRSQVIEIGGDTGAPRVRVTGPDGQTLDSTDGDGQAISPDTAIRIISLNEAKITSVGLQDPRPGDYTIEPISDTPAITQVSQAEDPADAKIKARVTGGGDTRTLEYDIRRRPDQRVNFFDVTEGGAEKQIATVKGGGRGSLRFAPAPGDGKHQIVAQFELAGLAAERKTVANSKPPAPTLPKPRQLRVVRHGKTVRASWGRVPGADAYEVAVTGSTGAQKFDKTRKTHTSIKVPKSSAGRVSVRAVAKLRQGAPSLARFKRTAPARTSLTSLPHCNRHRGGLNCNG